MKTWIRSRAKLEALCELGLIERAVEKVELPIANFPEEKLQLLPRRQRLILEFRFIKGYNYEEVGKEFAITRERVRQLEMKALWTLLELSR